MINKDTELIMYYLIKKYSFSLIYVVWYNVQIKNKEYNFKN